MATSAFKSTSRRGAAAAEKAPPLASASRRRSHSVSAVSRKTHAPFVDKTLIPTEFSNSRDNPLFWTTSSPPPDREEIGKIGENTTSNNKPSYYLNSRNSSNGSSSCNSVSEQGGRSVTRSFSEKNGIGCSLSRVRDRFESRAPCNGGPYESEKEQDTVTFAIAQSRNEIRKIGSGIHGINSVGNRVDRRSHAMNAGEWSEDDSACSVQISNLEDGISIGSLSESEEKTFKAASNEINALLRSNVNTFTATNVADTLSDFVNPEAVELISVIRREYAIKLEESEERTRKLRADLAVEERRGKELDRILKEVLLDPKTSGVRRSFRGRRTSNERKLMSKCLTEDAMAYFDECVSLSTIDSSDFSASEDPPYSSAGATVPAGASSLVKGSPSTLCCYDQGSNDFHQKQIYGSQVQLYGYEEDSSMSANSSNAEPGSTQLYHFSFTDKKSENVEPEEDIRSYIKNFKKGTKKDIDLEAMSSYYDAGAYSIQGHGESMLIDRVLYNSRIESGGLLLCGGANSFLPFAPII